MVAECNSEETGVGPSIASGNQKCNGNCADFPTAPAKSPNATTAKTDPDREPASAR